MEKKKTTARRKIEIDFLYLDLTLCDRCIRTDGNLREALSEAAEVLKDAGVDVTFRKIQVTSEAEAKRLGFVSSPTIRVNGRDMALEFRESRCGDCEEVAGAKGIERPGAERLIDCRVWVFQGKEYTEAPKEMIVDAILREISGGETPIKPTRLKILPENLRRFFSGRAASSCCAPAAQEICCEPSEKESCCGTSSSCGL